MGVYMSFGILDREDPDDPTSRPLLRWPAPLHPDPDTLPPLEAIRARPTRSLNGHAWEAWCHHSHVQALLTHCRVPIQFRGFIAAPVDAQLLYVIRQMYAAAQHGDWPASHIERAQWLLDWAKRAQATFGAQARISFS